MRVLIAPDSFGDTMSAVTAARAIARGWAAARPDDELVEAPQSDGGPGFVDVLAARLGEPRTTRVHGPLGAGVDARWLYDADAATAYVECAQACGLHQLGGRPTPRTAVAADTFGVGEVIATALGAGARRIVVGLGGSATTDGGRGLVRALARAAGAGDDGVADGGVEDDGVEDDGVADAARSDADALRRATDRCRDVEIVVASDVENPLLGPHGAAAVFGPQKGADADTVVVLEEHLTAWAATLREVAGGDVAGLPGAGAAGGLGAALLALGGRRVSGATVVADATDLAGAVAASDVVLTGEGRFDSQTLRGKVVAALHALASKSGARTIVLAGQVTLTAAEIERVGIEAAHALVDVAGSVEVAMSDAENQLSRLAESVATRVVADPGTRTATSPNVDVSGRE